jgi:hypothetical protein
MIVGLLILIVLILLFGAGVIKGWLLNVTGVVCGGVLLIAILAWIMSSFEMSIELVGGILGVILLLPALAIHILAPPAPARKSPPPKPKRKR